MASVSEFEEQITCSVCLEVYTDPHALTCLHTYCYRCVDQLSQGQRVQCPDCRKYTDLDHIQKNFTLQSFIDLHKKSTKIEVSETTAKSVVCDVCRKADKTVASLCQDCEEFLCADCTTAHRGSKSSRNHKLQDFGKLFKSKQQELQDCIDQFHMNHIDLKQKTICQDEKLTKLHEIEVQHVACVNQIREDIKTKVDKHHDEIIEQIKSAIKEQTNALQKNRHLFEQGKSELRDRIDFLTKVGQSQDFSLIVETLNNIRDCTESHQLQVKLPTVPLQVTVEITVEPGDVWNAQSSTKVNIAHSKLSLRRDVQIHHGKDCQIHSSYQQMGSGDIECWPSKLHVAKDKLWVSGGDKGIFVYNLDCEQVDHFQHKLLKCVTSLVNLPTETEKLIICDGETGLHLLKHQGGITVTTLSAGAFSDVCLLDDKLFVLEYKERSVIVFCNINDSWVKQSEFQLSYSNGCNGDKLCATSTCVYISSVYNNCVYGHTLSGEFQCKTGYSGGGGNTGRFKWPYLGAVDRIGQVLVCDCDNHRLQVLSPITGDWRELIVMGPENCPVSAGVGQQHIWVGMGSWPLKIIKYECIQ